MFNFHYPGAIVPHLPEKSITNRFSPEFVEKRRLELEKFMINLSAHPELSGTPMLVVFLTAGEDELNAYKEEQRQEVEARSLGSGIMKWIENLGSSKESVLEQSVVDEEIESIRDYATQLKELMERVTKNASDLTERLFQNSDKMQAMSESMVILAQAESSAEENDLVTVLSSTSDTLSVISAQLEREAEKTNLEFYEPLKDNYNLVLALLDALDVRAQLRDTYEQAVRQLHARQAALQKYMETHPTNGEDEKGRNLSEDVERAEEFVNFYDDKYERANQRLVAEYDRFKAQKARNFKYLISSFITNQMEMNGKLEESWSGLIPTLQQIQIDDLSSGFGSQGETKTSSLARGGDEESDDDPISV
jgi:sorting nexin-4